MRDSIMFEIQVDISGIETMTGLKNFKNQFLLKRNWN